jgi:hypothetical protein
MRKTDF